jgi:hypothetical protein
MEWLRWASVTHIWGCHRDSSQFKPFKGRNLTTRHTQARRALWVAIVQDVIKETIRPHLTLVHIFHAYASRDTPWVARALSWCTVIRYGRIASISVTHEATQFVGPQEIPYALVHNSKLLTEARRSVLIQLRRGLPPWSFEFTIQTTLNLPKQLSPLSPNCPVRSQMLPTSPVIHLNHIEPPKWGGVLSRVAIDHLASTDSLHH